MRFPKLSLITKGRGTNAMVEGLCLGSGCGGWLRRCDSRPLHFAVQKRE